MATEQDQLALEREMRMLGAERQDYLLNNRRAKRMESLTPYGEALTIAGVEAIITEITVLQTAIKAGKAGKKFHLLAPLLQAPAKVVAVVAMRVVLDRLHQQPTLNALGGAISHQLWAEVQMRRADAIERERIRGERRRWKVKVARLRALPTTTGWDPRESAAVGQMLVHLIAERTGFIELATVMAGPKRQVKQVRVTEACMEWIEAHIEASQFLCPFLLPMLVPPRPWTGPREGGYLSANAMASWSLFKRGGMAKHFMAGAPCVVAANLQQAVAWRINDWMVEQVRLAWDNGIEVGKLPRREGWPIPPYPKGMPDDSPEVYEWRRRARGVHERNDADRARRIIAAKMLWIAGRLAGKDLYFPVQLDFRGRYYYAPPFINPQANDLGRAMLRLADGQPITSESQADWMRVHGANCYGLHGLAKADWQTRVDWVKQNHPAIRQVARDPWSLSAFWQEASEPWRFLAFCREYSKFLDEGLGFVTTLPISTDCTCSGIQHYAGLLRDKSMARLVNVIDNEEPADVYSAVLNVVLERLRDDAAAGKAHARDWLALGPDRTLAKPIVMTLPYSATRHGVVMKLRDWAWCRSAEQFGPDWSFTDGLMQACHYMADVMENATSRLLNPAKGAMAWLKAVGRAAGRSRTSLTWTTPSGLVVEHRYANLRQVRVWLNFLSGALTRMSVDVEDVGLDSMKMAGALAPNLIHSMDASHMALTTVAAMNSGVVNLAGVHDCFCSTAAEMPVVAAVVRQVFSEMYEQPLWTELVGELVSQLDPAVGATVPAAPTMGELELSEASRSTYFTT